LTNIRRPGPYARVPRDFAFSFVYALSLPSFVFWLAVLPSSRLSIEIPCLCEWYAHQGPLLVAPPHAVDFWRVLAARGRPGCPPFPGFARKGPISGCRRVCILCEQVLLFQRRVTSSSLVFLLGFFLFRNGLPFINAGSESLCRTFRKMEHLGPTLFSFLIGFPPPLSGRSFENGFIFCLPSC